MSVEQILADLKQAEETEAYKGYKVSDLRKVFEAVQNKNNWKLAWAASVHHSLVQPLIFAVEYFHGDSATVHGIESITGNVMMSGNGYQCE